ncbi:hypothetical protein MXB_3221 [Myxobolus squamalis]|nr:hypothetical protein MXB_3221 [Myxobolus squamalis]
MINVPSISSYKLIRRLNYILKNEDISYDVNIMSILHDKFSGDIRQCINNLQFFISDTSKITMNDLKIISKTMFYSNYYFESMQQIFQVRTPRQNIKVEELKKNIIPKKINEPQNAILVSDESNVSKFQNNSQTKPLNSNVKYKYHDGCTNCIKRETKIKFILDKFN